MTVYGISHRARNYVRRRATAVMEATCRIERVQPPTFDMTTGTATPGGRLTVYEGPCRVWEITGQQPIYIGEQDIVMQGTQLSIPWDITTVPKRDDEVQILTHQTDAAIVGKRFVIDSSAKAGDLRATRRFTIRGYQQR